MASRSAKMKKTKINEYNAKGSPESSEAMDEAPGFKKGGKTKSGGKMEGKSSKARADKPSRAKRAAGGRTPYTSGHDTSDALSMGDKNNGHESERP